VAERIIELVTDPARAKAMGQQGLDWVHQEWRWDLVAARLQHILDG
jgi:phosphatidylinositol alpha-1,6-mannosyltransferase